MSRTTGVKSARILAIHRYFWPDTPPYAVMLKVIAERWAAAGHAVEVLSSQPSYKPELAIEPLPRLSRENGVLVRRIRVASDRTTRGRRTLNIARFAVLCALRVLLGRRQDVVMCSTAPPVVLASLVSLAARLRGSAFIYHCMDIHPEIGRLSGEFSNRRVFAALQRVDLATCRRAAAIVVLSDDMADALCRRDPGLRARIRVINNFDLPGSADEPAVSPLTRRQGVVRMVFTGNIGRFQNLEQIVDAVLVDDPSLDRFELVLMGEGAAKAGIAERLAGSPHTAARVTLLPHGPVAAARALMAEADLGLVALTPGVVDYAYPSKTASYLAEGLPVVAAVEPNSALARDLERWDIGSILTTSSKQSLVDELVAWTERSEEIEAMRARARQVWEKEFSVQRRLPEWDRLVESVAFGGAA